MRTCSADGCPELHSAKGFCRTHYAQHQRGEQPRKTRAEYTEELGTCAADKCDNAFQRRSIGSKRLYCSRKCRDRTVKAQLRASGEWVPAHKRPGGTPCMVDGCESRSFIKGYCPKHHERVRKCGDPNFTKYDRRPGEWRPSAEGYLYRFVNGEKQLQHRVVMEEHLGRPLWPDESVHHLNGNRADNCIENLELWSSYQPSGQRVEDKIAYAREILARYT